MNAQPDKTLSVGLMGYGRLARHLAPALVKSGVVINQWYIRNQMFHTEILDSYDVQAVNDIGGITDKSDVIIIMISDHAIEQVAAQLNIQSSIVCHTSGTSLLDFLPQVNSGILYPLNTYNGINVDWSRDTPFFIQAKNEQTFIRLERLANLLSDHVQRINPDDLQTIHLAAVIAQNFSNHLIAQAEHLLVEKGIDRKVLYPLLLSMIENLRYAPAAMNQTGPAIRHDLNTIENQQELLEKRLDLRSIYIQLSKSIQAKLFD